MRIWCVRIAIVGMVALSPTSAAVAAADLCRFQTSMGPGVRWQPARPGERLNPGEVLLTCTGGEADIESSVPFRHDLHWERDTALYRTSISGDRLIVIPHIDEPDGSTIELIAVRGNVLVSRDRDAIRKSGIVGARSGPPVELQQRKNKLRADLEKLHWRLWRGGEVLGPWTMIWIREGGRAEVEILRRGPTPYVDRGVTVLDSQGRPTRKLRFVGNTYFVVDPDYYAQVRVNKVLGEVVIADAESQVQALVGRYGTPSAFFGQLDRDAYFQREQMLRREDLE